MNNSAFTTRVKRLQDHLSSQYVDFDKDTTTDRLHSLYSDFYKLKVLNPYGYEANVDYWRAVILECNVHGYLSSKDYSCFIDKDEITDLFHRPNKGKPLSLDHVISDMVHVTHDLLTQKEYEERYPITIHATSFQWLRWIYYQPIRWLIPETPSSLYIVLPTIQEYCKIIVQKHYLKPLSSSLDNLFSFHEFKELYGTIPSFEDTIVKLSDLDIWMVLRYLNHCYGVALAETIKTFGASSIIIKFPDRNESALVAAKITENDKAVINLKSACSIFHRQVDELQIKLEEFIQSSKEHYKNGRKSQALYMLKKKNQVLHIIDRRLKTLETLETILLKIEASQNDFQVVQAFNLGADALRTILNDKDLNPDSIEKTMEKVQDSLEDQEDIESAIKAGNDQAADTYLPDVNDEELEKELDSLADTRHVNLTQPIDTESELLRLESVLSSLNHPAQQKRVNKIKELA